MEEAAVRWEDTFPSLVRFIGRRIRESPIIDKGLLDRNCCVVVN